MTPTQTQKRLSAMLLFVALLVWLYWGNTSIQITEIGISSEKIPESFQGFTIVQVSDLHNTAFGEGQSRLLRAIKNATPDMIAVTGDLIDSRRTDVKTAMEFISGAVEIAPVYFVTGNHEARTNEYATLKEQLKQAGVVILNDESREIAEDSATIRLIGVNDPDFTAQFDSYTADSYVINETLKVISTDGSIYTILLSHRPELFEVYKDHGIDLVLSGHAHGGQFRLPFIGGLVAPNQGIFPHYSAGVYEESSTKMIVSRGLGNSIIPIRLNNRPELVVIALKSSKDL